jgi:hypothetical protein
MQHLIFESSSAFVFLCVLLGLGYAYLLYKSKHTWSKRVNRLLFALRAILVALLSFLLMGPVLKLTNNLFEKPALVFLIDNSTSLKENVDSLKIQNVVNETARQLRQQGFDIVLKDLSGQVIDKIKFDGKSSDLNGALRNVVADYEGKNLAGIVLLSDGIYNSGASPFYTPWHIPLTTVGLGDTVEHADLILKNVMYNKVAYQGNKFPVRAEVAIQNMPDQDVTVSILKNGSMISQQKKNTGKKLFLQFDFLEDAKDKGIQRWDVLVEPSVRESNPKNNRSSIFVDVVEGRKKILVIAPSPHPDIKALRTMVEKNPNYEFILHIPGITKTDPALLQPGAAELVIFHQAFDQEMKTAALFSQLSKGKSSLLLVVGNKTNLRLLQANGVPLNFINPLQKDDATPVVNSTFHDFDFSENSNSIFLRYPPVQVPFGKFSYPPNAQVMLNQRIGSVATDRPLLLSWEDNGRKMAAFIGEGMWRWRFDEFATSEKTEIFDETFSKLIQYLSTLEDKRKFRFFPVQNEFTDASPVIFEGQVYNDLFQKVYGNKISLTLYDDRGKTSTYNYTLSPGGESYRVGGLKEGAYRFTAATEINAKRETVSGQFLIKEQNIESLNGVADFGLLRKLSRETGAQFYPQGEWNRLVADFRKTEPKELIHSEESFNPLVQVKWFFFLLLMLISAEWFSRKYLGSY